jgi:hypothetical protein
MGFQEIFPGDDWDGILDDWWDRKFTIQENGF